MPDVYRLLNQLAAAEEAFRGTRFLAPCLRGGRVRAKVAGLLCTFAPKPHDFEGWGVFRAVGDTTAALQEEASLPQVVAYLGLLAPLRLRLVQAVRGQTWLAYPANESDARQRWGAARPAPVHLVTDGAPFEPIVARWDGRAWWFEELDRRADPQAAARLREALQQVVPPDQLRFNGLTPEMRVAYDLAAQQAAGFQEVMQRRRDDARLQGALRVGGGELREFQDRGDYWLVEWTARDGERHTSAIARCDLTVVSAGICLSGEDREFDLQSLVGVVERQWD
jgi:hypothetical protein